MAVALRYALIHGFLSSYQPLSAFLAAFLSSVQLGFVGSADVLKGGHHRLCFAGPQA